MNNNQRRSIFLYRLLRFLAFVILAAILLGSFYFGRRPFRTDIDNREIYPGVTYSRTLKQFPEHAFIHVLKIPISENTRFVTTPSIPDGPFKARTVSQFAAEFETDVAINANFFFPFESNSPWDFYPLSGDSVTTAGLAISDGEIVTSPRRRWSAFCIGPNNEISIVVGACPINTVQAVGGQPLLIRDGQIMQLNRDELAPRTALGINKAGDELILFVVDGRQRYYSDGISLADLAAEMLVAGAYEALNLDGGGSTTLVIDQSVQNAPIHTRIVMRERPVANHLGVIFE